MFNKACPGGEKGFTLIEVMVALTIFAAIAVSIGACVISGIKIWNTAKNVNFARANFMVDLDVIAADLRRSVDIPVIGFEGKALQFSFPSVKGNAVGRITYIYDPETKVLSRREASLEKVIANKADKEYSEKEALSLDSFTASYFTFDKDKGSYSWTDSWVKTQGPFAAIKLEGKFKGENFVKTVFIPISL